MPLHLPSEPMEARLVAKLPTEPGWQYEPKWDGFRCIAWRDGKRADMISRSGKPFARYFPEVMSALARVVPQRFVVDGELCIPAGNSLSVEALQMRLHPAASRIAKLSVATPALFILFDLLAGQDGKDLTGQPLSTRRGALEMLFAALGADPTFRLSPYTRSLAQAKTWLKRAGAGALDGVVAKRIDGPYLPGSARC